MLKSGVKAAAVAQKLKRSIGASRHERAISKSFGDALPPRTYSAKRLTGGFRASFAGLKIPRGETGTRFNGVARRIRMARIGGPCDP